MPLIVVQPGLTHSIVEGTVSDLKVTMRWSKNGEGLVTGGSRNVIAIYDLDLYLANQARLSKDAKGKGFFETTDRFFKNTPTDPGTFKGGELADHKVGPGTGVMMIADVVFRFRDTVPNPEHESHWFVESAKLRDEPSSPPFALRVHVVGRFDDKGNPLSSGAIGMRPIGLAAVPRSDFDAFFQAKGDPRRTIAVRVMTPAFDRVLLSNLNADQSTSFFEQPRKDGTKQKVIIKKRVQLSRSFTKRDVGDPGAPPEAGKAVAARMPSPDLTGYYVEDLDKKDDKLTRDPAQVVAPASLSLHMAGRAIVGWYTPLPDTTLASDVFDKDPRDRMLSTDRIALVGPISELPPELRSPALAETPADAIPILYARDPNTSDERLDPSDILKHRISAEIGWLRVVSAEASSNIVELHLGDGREARCLQLHNQSRLAWETLDTIRAASLLGALNQDSRARLGQVLASEVERLPPGIADKAANKLVSKEMFELLKRYSELSDPLLRAAGDPELALIETRVTNILDRVRNSLTAHHAASAITTMHTVLRSHWFIIDNQERSVFDLLLEMSEAMLDRRTKAPGGDKGSIQANIDAHLPAVFKELGLVPTAGFRYKFDFASQGLSGGVVLQASAGVFSLTISKERLVGSQFVPDTDFNVVEGTDNASFSGVYVGGGVGVGLELGLKKAAGGGVKPGAGGGGGGSGAPVTCVIESFHDLSAREFEHVVFNTAAFVKPNFSVSAAVTGIGTEAHETVLAVHVNARVVLTGTVTGFYTVDGTAPSVDSAVKHAKAWKDAVKSGDIREVPTIGASLTLAGVTSAWGILFPKKAQPPVLRKPDEKEQPTKPIDFEQRITTVAYERSVATLSDAAHNELDFKLASQRRLFELDGWCRIIAHASPEFGTEKLSREQADNQNLGLVRERAVIAKRAIEASLGPPGAGIIFKDKEFDEVLDIASNVRETAPPTPGTVLHPHTDAAKTPEGKVAVQTEERVLYPDFRRVDIFVNASLGASLPCR